MENSNKTHRRAFMKTASSAASAFLIVQSQAVKGTAANSKIEIGICGCGGRGQFVGRKMITTAGDDIQIVALQDTFQDRVDNLQTQFETDKSRQYVGLEAYKDLIASNLDAVAITSPPYFHPDQVQQIVAENKHVWLAKPVAVDVPGCQSVLETSKKAKGKVNFLVDFQTRNSPNFNAIVDQVHQGAIGDIVLGHVYYHAGRLGKKDTSGMSNSEARLRNWVFDIPLSGDIIVEQNVHVLDVANWYIGAHPIKARGTGGRKGRVDVGDCYDHFIVTYWYPNDIKVDFSSAQFTKGYDDLCIRMYGTKGTADSHYNGPVKLTGDNPWEGVPHDDTWNCVENNVKLFVKSIRSGDFINHGDYAVQSTLTGVLGREAAYSGEEVAWEGMMKANRKLDANLKL